MLFSKLKKILKPFVKKKRFQISVEFTNHCNFRCKFCPHSLYKKETPSGNQFDRPKGFISKKLFELVLWNAERYAREVVIGFFGEPMLHPLFQEFINSFPDKRRYKVILNTNWSLITAETMISLKKLDEVRISIDASKAEIWEQLCPGGKVLDLEGNPSRNRYAALVEKIEYWLSLPKHPRTNLVYVVSSVNKDDKERFLEQWLPKITLEDHIVTKTVISYGGIMYDDYMSDWPCRVIDDRRIIVGWDGRCSPCNLDVNLSLFVGYLPKLKDIRRISKSRRYLEVLLDIRQKKGICANCFDANSRFEYQVHCGERQED